MAGGHGVFYGGHYLWETVKTWKPVPTPQSPIEKAGTSRILGALSVRSRNFLWDIPVSCHISPQVPSGNFAALTPVACFNVKYLQVIRGFVEASQELADLVRVQDVGDVLEVASFTPPGGGYPGLGQVSFTGSGFDPRVVGRYVLMRDPGSEDGFVVQVSGIGGGAGTFNATFPRAVAANWEIYWVLIYFPDTAFITSTPPPAETQVEENCAFDATYIFKSMSNPVQEPLFGFIATPP